jgi:hypothetical protein
LFKTDTFGLTIFIPSLEEQDLAHRYPWHCMLATTILYIMIYMDFFWW